MKPTETTTTNEQWIADRHLIHALHSTAIHMLLDRYIAWSMADPDGGMSEIVRLDIAYMELEKVLKLVHADKAGEMVYEVVNAGVVHSCMFPTTGELLTRGELHDRLTDFYEDIAYARMEELSPF